MNLKLNWLSSIALLTISSGLLIGCDSKGGDAPKSDPGTTTPTPTGDKPGETSAKRPASTGNVVASGDTIKIGFVGSLTGDEKPWGEDSRDGAKLAVEEFNKAGGLGGKKVEMIEGDSASKAEAAKTAAEKVLSQGVIAVVGEVASGNTIQIANSAFPKGVPVIAIGATRTDLTDIGNNVFRVCYNDDFQGPLMAKFAYDLGVKNIAVMTDNKLPYSQALSKSFSDKFKALGGTIVAEEFYEKGATQFNGQITNLKAKNPDGLFLSGYFTEVGPIAKAAKDGGLSVKMFGGDGWDSPQILTSGGDAILGGFFCNHYTNTDTRAQVGTFLKAWRASHGGKVPGTTMGALGYDAMMLTLDSLKRAGKAESQALLAAIDNTENYAAVTGDITLKGQGGNPKKRALVVQVTAPDADGNFQKLAKEYQPGDLK